MRKAMLALMAGAVLWTAHAGAAEVQTSQWIVVAAPALRPSLDPLIERRRAQGFKVVVLDTTNALTPAEIHEDEVERTIVAGAFGNFLDLEAAARIGLLPSASGSRIVQIGNAAGAGVRRMLVCLRARRLACQLARRSQYLNLAVQPGLAAHFARRSRF